MIWRKKTTSKPTGNSRPVEGWTPGMLKGLIESNSQRGLGFLSLDFTLPIDAFRVEINNEETVRRAYGSIAVTDSDTGEEVSVSVNAYFYVPDDGHHEFFSSWVAQLDAPKSIDNARAYGKAVLDGRYAYDIGRKTILLPVFDLYFHLEENEWQQFHSAFALANQSNPPTLSVRIGFPANITLETIEEDGWLPIYRVWLSYEKIYNQERISSNAIFIQDLV
jgi:hypothetical protein